MVKAVRIEEVLRRSFKPVRIDEAFKGGVGLKGTDGRDGKEGVRGKDGKDGPEGKAGKALGWRGIWSPTETYLMGEMVKFNGSMFIALTDSINVRPHVNKKVWELVMALSEVVTGGPPPVEYTAVTSAEYTIDGSRLIVGHNVFGVDAGENATVYLPASTDPTKIILVNNEMESFDVTVQSL